MGKPRVSVVMSAFNAEKYVGEAIESILRQTYRDFEFIITDDKSADRTADIIAGYARKDRRIRFFRNRRNLGLTKTLNLMLRKARGEYIARMDADDIALPERFRKQVSFLDRRKDIVLVGTWANIIDAKGKAIGELAYMTEHDDIRRNMVERSQIIHPSVMFRRSVVQDIGGYDERLRTAQDYEYFARMMSKHRVANIPEKLMCYRWDFGQNEGFRNNRRQEINSWISRWRMFTSYGWPLRYIIYAIKPAISFCIPTSWRLWVVKKQAERRSGRQSG